MGNVTSSIGESGHTIEIEELEHGVVVHVTYPEDRRRRDVRILLEDAEKC